MTIALLVWCTLGLGVYFGCLPFRWKDIKNEEVLVHQVILGLIFTILLWPITISTNIKVANED